jgi:heme/copper-type cytochrome/quinol oxidase subunit 2
VFIRVNPKNCRHKNGLKKELTGLELPMKSYFLLLVFILIAVACGWYLLKMQTDIVNEQAGLSTPANFIQASVEDGFIVRQIALSAQKSAFVPNVIRAKTGEKVKINVTNIDATYRFYLPDFNIDVTLNPGEEKTIEFVVNKTGQFEFASDEKMKGKLVVE